MTGTNGGGDVAGSRRIKQSLAGDPLLAPLRKDREGRPVIGGIPLIARIGRGGGGAVYYAIHPRLSIDVAIKVLPFHLADDNPNSVKRFIREARMAAKVRSPNIVNVLDVDEERGIHYIVMEYVHGLSAGEIMRRRKLGRPVPLLDESVGFITTGGMAEESALQLCLAAAEGLAAAHDYGVIHRDIKPDNILVPRKGDSEDSPLILHKAKLADLGLAKPEAGSDTVVTVAQQVLGSPGFIAPEQIRDAKGAGKSADVFGLGATMYALLAGKPPFTGAGIGDILAKTLTDPHTPLAKVCPNVSDLCCDIVDRCLDKNPAARLQNAEELAGMMREALRIKKKTAAAKPQKRTDATKPRAMLPQGIILEEVFEEEESTEAAARKKRKKKKRTGKTTGAKSRKRTEAREEKPERKRSGAVARPRKRSTGAKAPVLDKIPRRHTTGLRMTEKRRKRNDIRNAEKTGDGGTGKHNVPGTGVPLTILFGAGAAVLILLFIGIFVFSSGKKKPAVLPDYSFPAAGNSGSQSTETPVITTTSAKREEGKIVRKKFKYFRTSIDKDGDGMEDSWEYTNLLDGTNISDAGDDNDGDGAINIQEYIEGTSPQDPKSHPNPGFKGKGITMTHVLGKDDIIVNFPIDAGQRLLKGDSSKTLYIEDSNTLKRARSFILFRIPSLPKFNKLISARLKLSFISGEGDKQKIQVGIASRNADYGHKYNWTALGKVSVMDGTSNINELDAAGDLNEYESLDATSATRALIEKKKSNNGFIIRYETENMRRERARRWHSVNSAGGKYSPKLEITYESTEGALVNSPPKPKIVSPTGPVFSVLPGKIITFIVKAEDTDDPSVSLKYAWDLNAGDGLDFMESTDSEFKFAGYEHRGRYLVVLKATDPSGGTGYATVVVNVSESR